MESRAVVLIVAASVLAGTGVSASAASVTHDLMPAPARLQWQPGVLAIDKDFRFSASGPKDPRVVSALVRLGLALQREAGLAKPPSIGSAGKGILRIEWVAAARPIPMLGEDESYTLEVDDAGGRLLAPSTLGVLRGLETFLQLVRTEAGVTAVPGVKIDDRPRFPWRGLLLDPCRRWQPPEVVKRTLDGMAAVKMNVLHWHLSEDQGFRLESIKFPALHEKGSDGLYYTTAQVEEIVSYAAERGIRVVPEFDMPGHTTSWLAGYPELGSARGPYELVRKWGIFDNVFDPSAEHVYQFIDTWLERVAPLFPDEYFHIGGDEVTPRHWNQNAKIQEFAYRQGLRDHADLQAHFNTRLAAILTRHKRKIVGWDEILHPDLPKNIVVQSWRGTAALSQAARRGYDGLLSNGYYLDLMHTAARHYAVDPVPPGSELTPDERRHVLGGEACMWGEYVGPENVDSRVWPRAAAIAERLWSPSEVRDVDDMYRRLDRQSARLDRLGLTHRAGYAPMLKRLVGNRSEGPLRTLADVLEPVKEYERSRHRAYLQSTPLNRLVDAARPESDVARGFRKDVAVWLGAGGEPAIVAQALALWKDNHAALEPTVAGAPDEWEIRSLSRDLSALAVVGQEALNAIRGAQAPPAGWSEKATRLLDGAQKPRAELEIAILPGIRKLVLAATSHAELRGTPREQWDAWLEKILGAQAPQRRH
jgi:hexosaminidase